MLETIVFLALFSRRKVSVDDCIILTNEFFYFYRIYLICKEKQIVYALKLGLDSSLFVFDG